MKKIKMIALDLDGTTLLDDHRSISQRMKQAIHEAVSRGILVVPTSGRIYSYLPSSVTALEGIHYAVTSNGSVIYSLKSSREVLSDCIPADSARKLLRNLPEKVYSEFWQHGKIYYARTGASLAGYPTNPFHDVVLQKIGVETPSMPSFAEKSHEAVEKINLPYLPPPLKRKIWQILSAFPEYSLLDTGSGIEVMHAHVSKVQGLKVLCRYLQKKPLQIDPQEIMAIGDSENDIEMLQGCGFGVAMGNAVENVKQAADTVTLSNLEDGAALAIEKYALS